MLSLRVDRMARTALAGEARTKGGNAVNPYEPPQGRIKPPQKKPQRDHTIFLLVGALIAIGALITSYFMRSLILAAAGMMIWLGVAMWGFWPRKQP